MSPKDVLVLLDIVEKSAKTPAYAQITGAAHDALVHATLSVLPEKEESKSPPSRKKEE